MKIVYTEGEIMALNSDRVISNKNIKLMIRVLAANSGLSRVGGKLNAQHQGNYKIHNGHQLDDTNCLDPMYINPFIVTGYNGPNIRAPTLYQHRTPSFRPVPPRARVIKLKHNDIVPEGAVYIGRENPQINRTFSPPPIWRFGSGWELTYIGQDGYIRTNLENTSHMLPLFTARPHLHPHPWPPAFKYVYDSTRTNKENPYSGTGFFPCHKGTT